MPKFDLIGLDADDTLWENERYYTQAQTQFAGLLRHYHSEEWVTERLYQTETRNIQHFGYGIKAFVLSMIETAVELTEGRVSGADIGELVKIARGMIEQEVELLDGVRASLPLLANHCALAVITKGDLLDQERKVERSNIGSFFQHVEVVSHKSPAAYSRLLQRHNIAPQRFLMVGNSLRSDILPVLELGGNAAYIPQANTWLHEVAEAPAPGTRGFYQLKSFAQLPALLAALEKE